MSESDTTPIFIAGPTASGKSALALVLAERLGGCIINADSMQVYGVLHELTARPSAEEAARAPHRLYGHVPPASPYSVGQWQDEAIVEIAKARDEGLVPIIVGGTGLYFKSLTEGLVDVPDIDDATRNTWRPRLAEEGSTALHAVLKEVDAPLAARLAPNDRQRILRGLEVYHATGTSLSEWQKIKPNAPLRMAHKILLMPDRDWLYERCNRRFEHMLGGAAKDEVAHLWALNLPPDMPVMKALGVKEIVSLLAGEVDRVQAIAAAQQATRRYAKRQMTWFRNQMHDWQIFTEQDYIKNSDKIFSYISKNKLTAK